MGLPNQTVNLTPDQIGAINQKLGHMRHNVNNSLAMLVATAELMRRKPESVVRFVDLFTEQPQNIADEIRKFSEDLQQSLGIGKDI